MTDTLHHITQWHQMARPEPDAKALAVQIGCHLEEICEMIDALTFQSEDYHPLPGNKTLLHAGLKMFADQLKSGQCHIAVNNRLELLDALADQVATAAGVAHCAGMDLPGALVEVNRSNWSKFENGVPVFQPGGKIAKGEFYTPPDLTDFV